jgi:hypothetical protein
VIDPVPESPLLLGEERAARARVAALLRALGAGIFDPRADDDAATVRRWWRPYVIQQVIHGFAAPPAKKKGARR